jgi:hypothetical protein
MASTERIPVLVTAEQKAKIVARARAANLPVGEFMRRAAQSFSPSQEDEAALTGLVAQVGKSTARAEKILDQAIKAILASEKRIAGMEAAHAKRRSRRAA